MDKFNDLGSDMGEMMEASGVNDVLPDGDYETQISAEGDWNNARGRKKKLTPEEKAAADSAKAAKKKARGEKFDKFLNKSGNIANKVGKGASIIKGASDAYNKSKAPKSESGGEVYEETQPSENPNKKLFIIGGIVVAVGVIGIIIFKAIKRK